MARVRFTVEVELADNGDQVWLGNEIRDAAERFGKLTNPNIGVISEVEPPNSIEDEWREVHARIAPDCRCEWHTEKED